ncbi:maltokinase N-terminal cap-like domain-containing protein [Streptomyces uncialis]|uniref:maltokinase N-terminal cap-like domain-containing protein n=1 Tax=Streptomyces uncialis TaxID=1048205 RepID=UPI0038662E5E|nr:phosphotransferase [Streptomyces uncialis]
MPEAVTRDGRTPARSQELIASLGPLLLTWLPRQRWFAGKGRPVNGFTVVSATELLPPGAVPRLMHVLVRAEQSSPTGPTADCYQLLVGVRRTLPPSLAPALIGRPERGPLRGATVYDALYDPRLADVLLEALRMRARVGELRFERTGATEIPSGLVPRVLGAEQSNSSLVYGDTFILKLFRRIVPGTHPDLELPLALATEGCRRVPPPAAWFCADVGARGTAVDEGTASARREGALVLGVLQPFLKSADDGWELALDSLARGGPFTPQAHALGRATAEVHGALARALPPVSLGRAQIEALSRSMANRLDTTARAVPALRPYADGLRTAFEALGELGTGQRSWTAQRVHGDLHLGQCLRAPDGEWSLIDFEGEPARPLAERRLPQPTVRDVAGMLRSFDYAARQYRPWSPDWADDCRAAYCTGYAEVSGRDPRHEPVLLRAYETDKAVYEVLYEARHRPDWLPVPLAAVARLATPSLPRP